MNSTFTNILRIILGLALLVFGLNKFLAFIPIFDMAPATSNFLGSLETSGFSYILSTVAILEILVGILLLLKKWVPFALILLAPISINILLFHIFLDVSGLAVAVAIVTINIILIYKYWKSYRPLFQ